VYAVILHLEVFLLPVFKASQIFSLPILLKIYHHEGTKKTALRAFHQPLQSSNRSTRSWVVRGFERLERLEPGFRS
jgi:hypothetical protein